MEKSGRSRPMEMRDLVPQKGLVKKIKKGERRWDVRNKWDFSLVELKIVEKKWMK